MLSLLFQLVTFKGVGPIFVLLAPKTAYGTEDMFINICFSLVNQSLIMGTPAENLERVEGKGLYPLV